MSIVDVTPIRQKPLRNHLFCFFEFFFASKKNFCFMIFQRARKTLGNVLNITTNNVDRRTHFTRYTEKRLPTVAALTENGDHSVVQLHRLQTQAIRIVATK